MADQYLYVWALAVSGNTLYAGGWFTKAGGNSANSIAKWNGSSWSALGSGMSGAIEINGDGPYVYALAVSGSTLYAGGSFTKAGGKSANSIAKWNGSSWSALGSGFSEGDVDGPHVSALAVSGSTLYAGGDFSKAGGNAANNIAQWNGSSWSPLGSGMAGANTNDGDGPYVNALAVSGSDMYAGGYFTNAGGVAANSIAKWNGSSWSALGSGMSGGDIDGPVGTEVPYVYALAVSGTGSDLYAGGDFTTAGGKVSVGMARAILRLPSLILWQTNSISVAVSWPSPSAGFVLQQNSDGLGSMNWSNVTDSILDDGTNKMITQPMGTNRFFRLVLP